MNTRGKGRREFLSTAVRATGGVLMGPAFIRQEGSRPAISYGTASGDVTRDRAIVWSRTDRRARMHVEWSTTESFQDVHREKATAIGPGTDFTARVELIDLPPGQRIFYRVQFEDLSDATERQPSCNREFSVGAATAARSHVCVVGGHRWSGMGD